MWYGLQLVSNQMTEEERLDLVVIGAGPAGIGAVVRAAQYGKKVAVVEMREVVGGCCVNLGCVPTKSMCYNTHLFKMMKERAQEHALRPQHVQFDLPQMHRLKDEAKRVQQKQIEEILAKNRVPLYNGRAVLSKPNEISIDQADGSVKKLNAENILIATGSESADLPFLKIDEKVVLSSAGCMELRAVPRRMIIIGAGAIGLEFGSIWSRLGAQVEFLEMLGNIGSPKIDPDVASQYQGLLEAQGMKFNLNVTVRSADIHPDGVTLKYETSTGNLFEISGDVVLMAVGRKPATGNLGLKEIGVTLDEKGAISVNNVCQSISVKSIFAAGDCTPGPMVAHKSALEAATVVEYLFGSNSGDITTTPDHFTLPSVIYTQPELSWTGKSEETLKREGVATQVHWFRYNSDMRDTLCSELEGIVKVIASAQHETSNQPPTDTKTTSGPSDVTKVATAEAAAATSSDEQPRGDSASVVAPTSSPSGGNNKNDAGRVLGVCIVGATAGDLISESVLAVKLGATIDQWGSCPHAHPFYKTFQVMHRLGLSQSQSD
ncbi:glycine cleavage system L2 protein [Pelomyxa schiedti]|nr:glycine cleavage system L2 protein [Pelomyxa schiedti]